MIWHIDEKLFKDWSQSSRSQPEKEKNKYTGPSYFTCYLTFQIENNKGADQYARMRRLFCAFVFQKQQSQCSSHTAPYDFDAQAPWPQPGYVPGLYLFIYKMFKI